MNTTAQAIPEHEGTWQDHSSSNAQIAASQHERRGKRSPLGYRIITTDDLDRAEWRAAAESERFKLLLIAGVVGVVAAVLTFGIALLVVPLYFIPAVQQWLHHELDQMTFGKAADHLVRRYQLAVRASHLAVSPPVAVKGKWVILSYDADAIYVTEPASATLIEEFRGSDVLRADTEVWDRHVRSDEDGRPVYETTSVLEICLRDPVRPLYEVAFGPYVSEAREWKARLRAGAERRRLDPEKALLDLVKDGVHHFHRHEHVNKVEWRRCDHCDRLYHAHLMSCPNCGARPS